MNKIRGLEGCLYNGILLFIRFIILFCATENNVFCTAQLSSGHWLSQGLVKVQKLGKGRNICDRPYDASFAADSKKLIDPNLCEVVKSGIHGHNLLLVSNGSPSRRYIYDFFEAKVDCLDHVGKQAGGAQFLDIFDVLYGDEAISKRDTYKELCFKRFFYAN